MRQSDVFPEYRRQVAEMTELYSQMSKYFLEDSAESLCRDRGYPVGESCQYEYFKRTGVGGFFEVADESVFSEYKYMYSKGGRLLLNGRYIIPVETVSGDLVSLIGYYPDNKKYITLATDFFSKECMFLNFKAAYELAYREFDGFVVLVEGVFDCISLTALGLPCIATMGASVSAAKGELLKLFKKVLAIPDDDSTGRKALNRYSKTGWKVPSNTTMLKFIGGLVNIGGDLLHCKDMDNFVTWYDGVDEILLSYRDSKEDIEVLSV